MTQSEINKNAVASVMAMEDAKSIYEAIGEINDDFSGIPQSNDMMDYSADDLLTVNPAQNDPMGVIPDLSGANGEMDEETQKFVVDKFAEMAANLPGDTIDLADITPIATVIKAENGIKQDVNSFLEKMMMGASQRLATQNISDAQPNGVAIDFDNDDTAGIGSDIDALGGLDGMSAMPEAPGGVEAPSLDANVGDEPSFDGIGDDLTDSDGSVGLGEDTFDAGAIDSAMDDNSADDMDMGAEFGDADMAASEADDAAADADMGAAEADESAAEADEAAADADESAAEADEFAADADVAADEADADAAESDESGDEADDDVDFESTMQNAKAQLESIRGKYIRDRAAGKIRGIIESFQARKANDAKKAKLESIVANYKKKESAKALAESAERREIDAQAKLSVKLESIVNNYVAAETRKADKIAAKKALAESVARSDRKLKATLESISAGYHGAIRKEAATKAKLESILANYSKKAKLESAERPSGASELQAKLDKIVASVK